MNPRFLLVTGFCFVAGLFITSLLFEKTYTSKDQIYIDQPNGFEFKNHKTVDDQAKFTVEGELINTQDIEWNNIQLVVSIFAGDAFMTYCRNSFGYVGKRSSLNFRVVCRVTEGFNLPENITYELSVARAARN
jgi:hypothetical protein